MTKQLITNYTFNKTNKTVTLNDYNNVRQEGVLLITNVTDNIILYNFADSTYTASVSGNVITLNYDTSSMSDTDYIQILYEDGIDVGEKIRELAESQKELTETMLMLVSQINTIAAARGIAADLRVTNLNTPNMTTLTTCSTVTNLSQIGAINAADIVSDVQNISAQLSNINYIV